MIRIFVTDQHQDALPAILPFSHILGFSTELLISIFKGVKLVTQPKFIPDKFVDLLKNHKITYLLATPPLGKSFIILLVLLVKKYFFSVVSNVK